MNNHEVLRPDNNPFSELQNIFSEYSEIYNFDQSGRFDMYNLKGLVYIEDADNLQYDYTSGVDLPTSPIRDDIEVQVFHILNQDESVTLFVDTYEAGSDGRVAAILPEDEQRLRPLMQEQIEEDISELSKVTTVDLFGRPLTEERKVKMFFDRFEDATQLALGNATQYSITVHADGSAILVNKMLSEQDDHNITLTSKETRQLVDNFRIWTKQKAEYQAQ